MAIKLTRELKDMTCAAKRKLCVNGGYDANKYLLTLMLSMMIHFIA